MIEIVAATRLGETEFMGTAALGISLRRLEKDRRISAQVACSNRRGLPEVYNARIAAANGVEAIVFTHDDVWLDDYFIADRVLEALRTYDVIGVAGNRRRVPGQPGWLFTDANFTRDNAANLSGAVAHGKQPFAGVNRFGPVPADCELLDGVFLAANLRALREKQVGFDPRFDFHCYDMDFCRTARERGLRLGTWPICITHQSPGAFGTEAWEKNFRAYIEKWGS